VCKALPPASNSSEILAKQPAGWLRGPISAASRLIILGGAQARLKLGEIAGDPLIASRSK